MESCYGGMSTRLKQRAVTEFLSAENTHSICVFWMYLRPAAIISLYCINKLVFTDETEHVDWELKTDSQNVIQVELSFLRVNYDYIWPQSLTPAIKRIVYKHLTSIWECVYKPYKTFTVNLLI